MKKLEEAAEENEYVTNLEEASEENEYTQFNLYAHIDNQSPYMVTLHVDGIPQQMKIDMGSSYLSQPSSDWGKQHFGGLSDKFDVLQYTTSSSVYSGCPGLSSQR